MLNLLASFPKSGNTWVRAFIDAYLRDKEPDINDMIGTFSDSYDFLYNVGKGVNITELPYEYQLLMRPAAMLRLNELTKNIKWDSDIKCPIIVKTHIANIMVNEIRLMPPSLIKRVLYLVRDPREVVQSYAKHFGKDLDGAIESLTDHRYALFDKNDSKVIQFSTSWDTNVKSYATSKDLDVSIVKYEQLKEDPVRYFKWILNWFEIEIDENRIKRAVKNCELSKLRKQEKCNGFSEASGKSDFFFGQGQIDSWKTKLTLSQINKIEEKSEEMMKAFGYLNEVKQVA